MGERKSTVIPSVYELLASRTKRIQQKKGINDGFKFDLMLLGGGPGAAAQVGFLMAMGEMGFHKVFDRIPSVSVGILHATYFAAGQMAEGQRILSEHVNDRLISLKRWIRRKG